MWPILRMENPEGIRSHFAVKNRKASNPAVMLSEWCPNVSGCFREYIEIEMSGVQLNLNS